MDLAWFNAAITGARPKVLAALMRYFRDLDAADEACQEACLRALQSWPKNGPPRDVAAWLILVGRNVRIDEQRKRGREVSLDPAMVHQQIQDGVDLSERLDESQYGDDLLRLMFVCCLPQLPETQGLALALKVVCGLSVAQIARAFLVSEAAMEQRITRAKRVVAAANLSIEVPDAPTRAARLGAVCTLIYLMFNEGYSASGAAAGSRGSLCHEAIRFVRLLLQLFPSNPEVLGLAALLMFQHARTKARFSRDGQVVLLEHQDRSCWDRSAIDEAQVLLAKAIRHQQPGPYQIQAAIAALHCQAPSANETDWAQIERLYASLERMQPSPIVRLNRAVALAKVAGAAQALELIEPLQSSLRSYFYFHGLKGALLQQVGRTEEARQSLQSAIGLANTAAEALHIREQLDRLSSDAQT